MSIVSCLEDAHVLWKQERYEGAFLLVLVAVAATSRRLHPDHKKVSDRQAFEAVLKQGWFERISVEYADECLPVYQIFYKYFRCNLVHEGGLPIDIEFLHNLEPAAMVLRAGGLPEKVLKISPGWFHALIQVVIDAPVNKDLFAKADTKTA